MSRRVKRRKDIQMNNALLRRKEGATLDDLTSATGWQKHSVHGFLRAPPEEDGA
jgi:hypothetical protein